MPIDKKFKLLIDKIADLEADLMAISEDLTNAEKDEESFLRYRLLIRGARSRLSSLSYSQQLNKGSRYVSDYIRVIGKNKTLEKNRKKRLLLNEERLKIAATKSMFGSSIWKFEDILYGGLDYRGASILNNGGLVEQVFTVVIDGLIEAVVPGIILSPPGGVIYSYKCRYYGRPASSSPVPLSLSAKIIFADGALLSGC